MAALDLDLDALTHDDCAEIESKKADVDRQLAEAGECKERGNVEYKQGNYEQALEFYSQALDICPGSSEPPPSIEPELTLDKSNDEEDGKEFHDASGESTEVVVPVEKPLTYDDTHNEIRAIYHCNRAACFQQLGNDEDVINECDTALSLSPRYVKALMRRGQAYEKAERYSESIKDYQLILEIDPKSKIAKDKLVKLEKLEADRLDKLKEETMGKLKDLGNSLLGNFGLSTDNFKFDKDENTGSYNIQFVQNANP